MDLGLALLAFTLLEGSIIAGLLAPILLRVVLAVSTVIYRVSTRQDIQWRSILILALPLTNGCLYSWPDVVYSWPAVERVMAQGGDSTS